MRDRYFTHANPPVAAGPRKDYGGGLTTSQTSPSSRLSPWVQLKYFTFHPSVYPRMVGETSGSLRPGTTVHVYDKNGDYFGAGFFNPTARVPLRMFYHGTTPVSDTHLPDSVRAAAQLRHGLLGLNNAQSLDSADKATTCFRVVNSDGDGVPGLVVDRYNDTLSVEVTTLGAWQRLPEWLPILHTELGTRRTRVQVDPEIASIERIRLSDLEQEDIRSVKFVEHGIRYEADFSTGHKTGFFCDQRDNRKQLGEWTQGRRVLDLCCYTGGFALAAKLLGNSPEVTAVDLDEKAIAQAKRNMNLNQTRLNLVHADTFTYARQMQKNGTLWPVIVLDPPKFVGRREDTEDGLRKYYDLNALVLTLAEPGALFVTCSCSGLISAEIFEATVIRAAHRVGRRLQILDRTGAGADHPVMSNCPESRYLKVIWAKVV